MEKEVFDLRDLMIMIKGKKGLDASLTLEFDCQIEVDDIKPLVKVINYAINYISQLTDQSMQISLSAGVSGYSLAFTAASAHSEFPDVSEQVHDALGQYGAKIESVGEPGKFAQLLLTIPEPEE